MKKLKSIKVIAYKMKKYSILKENILQLAINSRVKLYATLIS